MPAHRAVTLRALPLWKCVIAVLFIATPAVGSPPAPPTVLIQRLEAIEAQDPQRRHADELGTLRAWIDVLRSAKGRNHELMQALVDAQFKLVTALVEMEAVARTLEPLLEETEGARSAHEVAAAESEVLERQIIKDAEQAARPRFRRRLR